jgi:hypothetical protein
MGVVQRGPRPYGAASRILVRDAFLANGSEVERMRNLDMPFTEVKTEVSIDRLTSTANPRSFERDLRRFARSKRRHRATFLTYCLQELAAGVYCINITLCNHIAGR